MHRVVGPVLRLQTDVPVSIVVVVGLCRPGHSGVLSLFFNGRPLCDPPDPCRFRPFPMMSHQSIFPSIFRLWITRHSTGPSRRRLYTDLRSTPLVVETSPHGPWDFPPLWLGPHWLWEDLLPRVSGVSFGFVDSIYTSLRVGWSLVHFRLILLSPHGEERV